MVFLCPKEKLKNIFFEKRSDFGGILSLEVKNPQNFYIFEFHCVSKNIEG
jgi:hypothetical protein